MSSLKFLLFTVCPLFAFCQKIDTQIRVQYLLTAHTNKLDKKNETQETFILLANRDEALFKSTNSYVVDSLKQKGENYSDFLDVTQQNNIAIKNRQIDFSNELMLTHLGYKEDNKFDWKLQNDFKQILGKNCQKATTEKYGRKWVAYFSADYPFPFGPYKFNGLPGLILELYDSDNIYHYEVKIIKKINKQFLTERFDDVKYVTKENYLKAEKSLKCDFTAGGKFSMNINSLKQLNEKCESRIKNTEQLELQLN